MQGTPDQARIRAFNKFRQLCNELGCQPRATKVRALYLYLNKNSPLLIAQKTIAQQALEEHRKALHPHLTFKEHIRTIA